MTLTDFEYIAKMIVLIVVAVVSCFHNSVGNYVEFDYMSNISDDLPSENIIYDLKDAKTLFENFVQEHNKQYKDDAESQYRYEIFMKNLIQINKMNQKSRSEIYGITKFADMTVEELHRRYTGLGNYTLDSGSSYPSRRILDDTEVPDEFDWRTKHVVTPVGDQGDCGSCWAFSAVGVAEGQYAKNHNQLLALSQQQLLDCWTEGGGCDTGSLPHLALNGVSKMGGFMKLSDYPYKAVQGSCAFRKESVVVKVRSGTQENVKDEEELKKMLYQYGPLSIGMYVSQSFYWYQGNVLVPDDDTCPPDEDANHAVLLVGYGTERGVPYWLIKNSWGYSWGYKGYLKIIRGKKACKITSYVATADVV